MSTATLCPAPVNVPSTTCSAFKPGQRVRRIGAPDITGTVRKNALLRDGAYTQRVIFDGGYEMETDPLTLELLPDLADCIDQIRRCEFSAPAALRANLLHQRLHGGLNEVLFSMEASNTTFLPYQFKPVLKLLESPFNSLLIADEVGLGKTIEAGLIWTELRARENARTLLVVCPPHLVTKWRNELKKRFGVDAHVASPKLVLEKLEDLSNGSTHGFALICSYHGIRPPDGWNDDPALDSHSAKLARKLDEWAASSLPFLDLLIMDEAAIMRNPSSQTSELGSLLTPIARYKVLLSATPVHTRSQNLFTLLRLLDPDTYQDQATFRQILEANVPLVRLRETLLNSNPDKERVCELLAEARRSPLLANNLTLAELERELHDGLDLSHRPTCLRLAHQAERASLLSQVVTRTRRRDVDKHPVKRNVRTFSIPIQPVERAFYDAVTAAVLEYAEKKGFSTGFLTVMPQRMVASCMSAALERFCGNSQNTETHELSPDLVLPKNESPETGPLMAFLREKICGRFNAAELREVDSKYTQLRELLREHWSLHPGSKVVLFAFFKPTLRYLSKRLQEDGIGSILLTGDETGDKQDVINTFEACRERNLLLSSEVGSEGLDLQFASTLINYDLPWNPMVVAQRIGRIHRIGQKANRILIRNLVCKDTVDERICVRLFDRINLFEDTIGDLETIIGEGLSELTRDLMTLRLTPEEENERADRAAKAIENLLMQERKLEEEAGVLSGLGDYLIQRISDAHRRGDWIRGRDLEAHVVNGFSVLFPGTSFRGLNATEHVHELELDPEAAFEFETFLKKNNLRGFTRICAGSPIRIRFENNMAGAGSRYTEVIHPSHPLVQFISHSLEHRQMVRPLAVAAELPAAHRPEGVPPGIYIFITQRWRVEGLRSIAKLHHQVTNADGTPIENPEVAARLIEAVATHGVPLSAFDPGDGSMIGELADAADDLEREALRRFNAFLAEQVREDADRKNLLTLNVNQFEARKRASLNEVLERHLNLGRHSLAAATRGQLEAFAQRCEVQRRRFVGKSVHGGTESVAAGLIFVH